LVFGEIRDAGRLAATADHIVVSSAVLQSQFLQRFPKTPVTLLDPAWPVADLPLPTKSDEFHVALLMGMSHSRDALPLHPVLLALMARFDQMRLTISANLAGLMSLKRHEQVTVVPAMNWPDYRAWMQGRRFDALLYPLCAGGSLNVARSDSKLGEAAQFGAALLASESWATGLVANDTRRCVGIADNPVSWLTAISAAMHDTEATRATALRNRAALLRENRPMGQRAFWHRLLAVPRDASSRMAA
jgi:hypothetical protein